METSMRFSSCIALALALVSVSANRSHAETDLLPYQSAGYRYQVIGSSDSPPSGFEQPGFDDTAWSTGTAAFGFEGGNLCGLQSTANTGWPASSQLVLR